MEFHEGGIIFLNELLQIPTSGHGTIGQGLFIKGLALPIFCDVKVVFDLFNSKSPKI